MRKDSALSFAIRPLMLARALGRLGLAMAGLTAVPGIVALSAGDFGMALRLGLVVLVCLLLSRAARRIRLPLSAMQTNEALALAALVFALAPLAMAWPLAAGGMGFLDAFFEALSGVTTTGLSALATTDGLPPSVLFLRAWMQWYGGLGIVVFSLALLVRPGGMAMLLSRSQDTPEDLWGGAKHYAKRVLTVYAALTAAGWLLAVVAGAQPFDGLLYMLCAVSTGGYAPHDASLAVLGPAARVAVMLVCLVGATPTSLYAPPYRLNRPGRLMVAEVVALAALCLVGTAVVTACLRWADGMSWAGALGNGWLMACSAQSTSGFASTGLAGAAAVTKAALLPGMLVGGCLGSTAGGFKIMRLLLFAGLTQTFLARTNMPPRAVRHLRLFGKRVGDDIIRPALLLIVLYGVLVGLSWGLFLAHGLDPMDSLFEVVSAVGTVGLSTGLTGPGLPPVLKLVLCMDMLMGRVEILAVLVLANPFSWLGRRAHP